MTIHILSLVCAGLSLLAILVAAATWLFGRNDHLAATFAFTGFLWSMGAAALHMVK